MIFKLKDKLELSDIFKMSDNSVLLFYRIIIYYKLKYFLLLTAFSNKNKMPLV